MALTASHPSRIFAQKPHVLSRPLNASRVSGVTHSVPKIRQFNKQNQESVASSIKTISTALQDDPLTGYLAPDADEDAARQFVADYCSELLSSVSSAELLFHSDGFAAAALAHRVPEEMALPSSDALPSKAEAQSDRVKALSLSWNPLKQQFLQDHGPFIYISMMGVHPNKQRQGLGGQLLNTLCTIADKEKKWCYLDAAQAGFGLYLNHGFVPLHRTQLGPEAPVMQHMGRPPQ